MTDSLSGTTPGTVPVVTPSPVSESPELHYDYELDPEGATSGAMLVRLTSRDARVLDLGCAAGALDRVLVDRGCTVVGVEIDPGAAARAQRVCERVVVGDLDSMDLAAELDGDSFDVVIAGDVLEHLKDPARVLRALRGLLRPRGHLAISVPNVAHGSVRLALLHGGFPKADLGLLDRTHLQFLTRDTLLDLLAEGGWTAALIEPAVREPTDSEVPFPRDALTDRVVADLRADPEAWAYQWIVLAYPEDPRGLDAVPALVHRLGDRVRDLTVELAVRRTEADLDGRREQLTLDLLAAREAQLRAEQEQELLEAEAKRRDEAFRAALARRDERQAELAQALASAERGRLALEQRVAAAEGAGGGGRAAAKVLARVLASRLRAAAVRATRSAG